MFAIAMALAAATPSVIDAERAFAQMAQDKGQWTAFRTYAAPENTYQPPLIFVPQPTDAQVWLKGREDPPHAVRWWPTAAWVSCNGFMAVTTGGALWPDGRQSYFTTVWKIDDPDHPQWRWVLDHGGDVATARPQPKEPVVRRASCEKVSGPSPKVTWRITNPAPGSGGGGSERDFRYAYATDRDGAREVLVYMWTGKTYEVVLHDFVEASAK